MIGAEKESGTERVNDYHFGLRDEYPAKQMTMLKGGSGDKRLCYKRYLLWLERQASGKANNYTQ